MKAGRIAEVAPLDHATVAPKVIELTASEVLLPGLVDSHVHICEPGHADWEGFATATMAAAAGGITTLVDMRQVTMRTSASSCPTIPSSWTTP